MTAPPASTVAPTEAAGLLRRVTGVLVSPRDTYAAVAAKPRAFGVLMVILVVVAASTGTLLSTEVGRRAFLDQALSVMEGFGVRVTDQMLTTLESRAPLAAYQAVGSQVVLLPVLAAVIGGLAVGVFNALLGAEGTFRQAFAVVAHSFVVLALQAAFSAPLNYARETLASTTSLAIFFPMVDEASFAGRLLGSIDLFRLWWIVSLSIGFGVLFKRRTGPIAQALLALYILVMLIIAGARTALSGA